MIQKAADRFKMLIARRLRPFAVEFKRSSKVIQADPLTLKADPP